MCLFNVYIYIYIFIYVCLYYMDNVIERNWDVEKMKYLIVNY